MADMQRADLHVHTYYSDGTFSPEEAVDQASRSNVGVIAITDHDVVDGLARAIAYAPSKGIEVIPGVEMTAEYDKEEIHILGYFIDYRNAAFLRNLNVFKETRIKRIEAILKKINHLGFHLDLDDVLKVKNFPGGSLGRLHVARAMHRAGYILNTKEAFAKYIGRGASCFVERINVDYKKAIALIRGAGGIAVLAHPGVMGGKECIRDLARAGLGGIEVYHPDHSSDEVKQFLDIARAEKLLITGGSDCHGEGKLDGPPLGAVKFPFEFVEALKKKSSSCPVKIS